MKNGTWDSAVAPRPTRRAPRRGPTGADICAKGIFSPEQSGGSEIIPFEAEGGAGQTEDVSSFTGDEDDVSGRDQLASAHQLIGRFDPRTNAAGGSAMTVSLDLERIHFFDPETELAI